MSPRPNRTYAPAQCKLWLAGLFWISYACTATRPATAQQFYFSANCVSEIALEELCNVSFMRRSLSARFNRGTASKVKYSQINAWNYTDSSKLKMDNDLAARIGIIGLLFKKVVHRHAFSINYSDGFGDKKSLVVNFSDSQYVNPMLGALRNNAGDKEVR